MASEKFRATYSVSDGYVCGERPQHFTIRASDIENDMSRHDLTELFEDMMREDFEQNVIPEPSQLDEFFAWAEEVQGDPGKSTPRTPPRHPVNET